MLLSEFDIVFVMRKAIKGQAIANYLVWEQGGKCASEIGVAT